MVEHSQGLDWVSSGGLYECPGGKLGTSHPTVFKWSVCESVVDRKWIHSRCCILPASMQQQDMDSGLWSSTSTNVIRHDNKPRPIPEIYPRVGGPTYRVCGYLCGHTPMQLGSDSKNC